MARTLGRYELLRRLARGGMADVFLARRRAAAGIEKRLVIKRIRPELASDPRFVRLFVKEARLSVELVHANIVPVFDFGRVGDELFLAMEHVEGRDLASVLRRARERGEPCDPILVAHIGAECCRALDYAHRRRDAAGRPLGIVHRDVTPRNVLISFAGEVKLVDFGVASLASDELGRVRGTPAYMSPEQARGENVDGRSDVFSLGLILAEAVTGERVYGGPDALAQARAGDVPRLPETVDEGLRKVIEKATEPEAALRYEDARSMQQALDQIVVAARAADPARPGPDHQIGPWLSSLFGDEEEAPPPVDGEVPEAAGRVVTFLEDGEEGVSVALDALGAQTMRSIAETVGEGEEEDSEDDEDDEEPASDAEVAPVGARSAAGAERGVARRVPAAPVPVVARAAPRWPWAVAVMALAGGAAVYAVRAAPEREAPPAPVSSPSPVVAAPPAPVPVPDAGGRAAVEEPPAPVTAPAPAPVRRPAVRRLYPVDINSRPWAKVYIDDRYVDDTPVRAELAPGNHKVRFLTLDGATRTITIEVPRDRPVVEDLTPR